MVFWIRNYDLQILTAGLVTFTADNRFMVNHENAVDSTDWSLLITNVKIEDQGQYECQINTEPKMKLNINLMVKGRIFHIYYSWAKIFRSRLKLLVSKETLSECDDVMNSACMWIFVHFAYYSSSELIDVMEMDSPFNGATIEGKNFNVLKTGSTITLTCKVMENEVDEHVANARRIDWMKNGELLNVKVKKEFEIWCIFENENSPFFWFKVSSEFESQIRSKEKRKSFLDIKSISENLFRL